MKADTAERLAERALRMSDELNKLVRDIQANEPQDESTRLRHAIGRVMWAVYYELLKPTFEEYPSLEPEAPTEADPATTIAPAPRGTLSTTQPARPSAPKSRRVRQQRRSRRRLR
jgi:hypothetical protein